MTLADRGSGRSIIPGPGGAGDRERPGQTQAAEWDRAARHATVPGGMAQQYWERHGCKNGKAEEESGLSVTARVGTGRETVLEDWKRHGLGRQGNSIVQHGEKRNMAGTGRKPTPWQ